MKKRIIISTLFTSILINLAHSESVLYGSIQFDYTNSKDDISDPGESSRGRVSNMSDADSYIGLKGGEDLGNGIQIIYHLEWGFDGMEGNNFGEGFENRLAYIGLATQFGTLVAGRVENPFHQTVVEDSVSDDFNSFGETGAMRAVVSQFVGGIYGAYGTLNSDGSWANHHYGINDVLGDYLDLDSGLERVSNTIAYLSPDWNGFSFNAALIMDDDLEIYQARKHLDLFTINLSYEHESGFYGKVGVMQGNTIGGSFHTFPTFDATNEMTHDGFLGGMSNKNRKTTAWGGQIGYRTDQIGLSASYATAKISKVSLSDTAYHYDRKDKASGWDIGASYSFGDNYSSTVRIAYGESRFTGEDHAILTSIGTAHNIMKPKDKIISVGFEQELSERTAVWVEYQQIKQSGSHQRSESTLTGTSLNHNQYSFNRKKDALAIGIRHDF